MVTCMANELYPDVAFAAARVLKKAGVELEVPAAQVCCGQPAYNAGFPQDARKAALALIAAFEGSEAPIIVPSGSCGDMMAHQFPQLFRDSPELDRAEKFASRVREFSQFLVDDLKRQDLGGSWQGRVAYHPSCHLLRGMGLREQALKLISAVKGTELVPLEGAEECCGFGGAFSIKQPEISGAMLQAKLKSLEAAAPERVISCDLGCLMQMEGGSRRQGKGPRFQHLAQFLSESLP
jgi:L-lactate dehydrogenase complex protein LldE